MTRRAYALMILLVIFLSLWGLTMAAHAGSYCVTDPPRPGASTGFYVAQPSTSRANPSADKTWHVYDANGDEFRPVGANVGHFDSYGTAAGLPATGANTVRMFVPVNSKPVGVSVAAILPHMTAGLAVIPTNWTTTNKVDQATIRAAYDTWVAQAPAWTPLLNEHGMVGIANEWGADDSPVWRDEHIAGIKRLRQAGYTSMLVVDAGGSGQSAKDVAKYGQAILDADPLHDVLFDVHVYGNFHKPATATWMQDYDKAIASLKASGLPIIIGEFGPGRNIGPSPTMVTPQKIIMDAEANGWGWLPWAWDDNNLQSCASDDNGFSMTTKCGIYRTDSDLTAFGKTVVPLIKAASKRSPAIAPR